ncbi:MAG: hypothetical protein O2955_12400 [Planctomycetota bacterium]|nr:hypothetical protein [Planctomycetota bacterium]MDA1213311.1 hypothetical protein [Planctomycetota bacterium]
MSFYLIRSLPRLTVVVALASLTGLISGCGDTPVTQQVLEARRFLQVGQPQMALDALRDDPSAQGHYLQSISLERLKRYDAAQDQISIALQESPDELTFQAFGLRLRMHAELKQGKMQSVDQMIQLHQQHPSHPACALFTCYAYQARAIFQNKNQQFDLVTNSRIAGIEALKTAIAMSASVPELQREILTTAVSLRVVDGIKPLVDRLYVLAKDDIPLVKECVSLYSMSQNHNEAVAAANLLYQKNNRSEQTALIYAEALSLSQNSLDRDREFSDLHSKYPRNSEITSKYAIYLSRSDRLTLATRLLNDSIEDEHDPKVRQMLIYIAITIPLEHGVPETAFEQLSMHRKTIADRQLIGYFEARILYLQKKYQPALSKLARIVSAQKNDPLGNRALAKEALHWMERIIADREVAERLDDAVESASDLTEKMKTNSDEIRVTLPTESSSKVKSAKTNSGSTTTKPPADDPPESSAKNTPNGSTISDTSTIPTSTKSGN